MIAASPRLLQRATDRKQAAALLEQWLQPYRERRTRAPPRRWRSAAAGWPPASPRTALQLAKQAAADDAAAPGPVLLALELMPTQPEAEAIVTQLPDDAQRRHRQCACATCRALTRSQRYADAAQQLDRVTQAASPTWPRPG